MHGVESAGYRRPRSICVLCYINLGLNVLKRTAAFSVSLVQVNFLMTTPNCHLSAMEIHRRSNSGSKMASHMFLPIGPITPLLLLLLLLHGNACLHCRRKQPFIISSRRAPVLHDANNPTEDDDDDEAAARSQRPRLGLGRRRRRRRSSRHAWRQAND